MGFAAGAWKKIKTVAKSIGNKFKTALDWFNNKVYKPYKPKIDTLITNIPVVGKPVQQVLDTGSKILDDYNTTKPKSALDKVKFINDTAKRYLTSGDDNF